MASSRKRRKNVKPPLSSRLPTPEIFPDIINREVDGIMEQIAATDPTVSAAPQRVTVRRDEKDAEADSKAFKQDKKLLEAIEKLTKSMDVSNKAQKKTGIGGYIQDKVAGIKNMFTLEGAAGKFGIGKNDGSLGGAILGSVLKKRDERLEKAEFITKFKEFTEVGRSLSEEAAGAEGARRFETIKEITPKIEELERKQSMARAFGGSLSVEDQTELEDLTRQQSELSDFSVKPEKQTTVRERLVQETASGIRAEIAEASPEEQAALREADPEYLRGVFEGALSGVMEIEEEQLQKLAEISDKLTVSEEDKFEASRNEIAAPVLEEKKEEKESGIMAMIMSIFKGGIAKIGTILKGIASALLLKVPLLGKVLVGIKAAILALKAGALGAGRGLMSGARAVLSSPRVLKGLGAAAAVGAGAYTAYSGFKNAGEEAQSKLQDVDAREQAGEITPEDAELERKQISAEATENKGGAVGEGTGMAAGALGGAKVGAKLGLILGPKGAIVGGLAGGLVGGIAGSGVGRNIGGLIGRGVSKVSDMFSGSAPATPRRESLSQDMKSGAESLEAAVKVETPSVVNNSPTTIVNNNTRNEMTGARAPVRNIEPSYNRRLEMMFA